MTGDFEAMALYAGTGVSSITEIKPAAAVIDTILQDAAALLSLPKTAAAEERASPVCYADEISADYMGLLDEAAAATESTAIIDLLRTGLTAALDARKGDADQPPFAETGLHFARHMGILQRFADPTVAPKRLADVSKAILPAIILQRLQGLVPRLPEGDRRRAVAAVSRAIEDQLAPSQSPIIPR